MAATARTDVLPPEGITTITSELLPLQISREIEPDIRALMDDFATEMLGGVGISASFSLVDARVVGYLADTSARKVVGINETTRRRIRATLSDGVLAGEGRDALARRIRGVFDQASIVRAKAIAQTEVHSAGSFARHASMEDHADVIKARRWLATRDSRTRHNHRRLHRQEKPMGVPFEIPGTTKRAMYPGGFGVVAEDVNCRCVAVPVVERIEDAVDSDREMLAGFEALTAKWEKRLERAARRGFRAQERLALAALDRANV